MGWAVQEKIEKRENYIRFLEIFLSVKIILKMGSFFVYVNIKEKIKI